MTTDKQIEAAFEAAIDNPQGDGIWPRYRDDWIAGYKAAIEASQAQYKPLVEALERIAKYDNSSLPECVRRGDNTERAIAQDALAALPEELK